MVDALCSNMTSVKEQLRDVSSMGLKTVISELSSSGGNQQKDPGQIHHLLLGV